jgi:hypothetical protein
VSGWDWLAVALAGFITGAAAAAAVLYRHRARAWLSRRRGR